MKKRYLISATVLALILSLSVFFVSVYAAVSQTISVTNQISFAGNPNAKHFTINGKVAGTTNDSDDKLEMNWEYDYENQIGLNGGSWELGDLQFDSSSRNLDIIGITYTFKITNQSDKKIKAEFVGPEELPSGLNKTYYANKDGANAENKSSINILGYEVAYLQLKLTISDLEYNCKQVPVNFSINIDVAE